MRASGSHIYGRDTERKASRVRALRVEFGITSDNRGVGLSVERFRQSVSEPR